MALSQVEFYSDSLKRLVKMNVLLPNDMQPEMIEGNPHYLRETKTLYLLHGFGGNISDWLVGTKISELSSKYNLAVIMPCGENSFYLDRKGRGNAYETYIAKELPTYIKKTYGLSDKKEDVIIGGNSMGGYGALRIGIKYHEKYGHAFGFSTAFVEKALKNFEQAKETDLVSILGDREYHENVFGDLDTILERDVNVEYLIEKVLQEQEELPQMFLACGTEDILIEENRAFREFLIKNKIEAVYQEGPGIHNWDFWNEYLEKAIAWGVA